MRRRLRKRHIPKPRKGRKLIFAQGPESGRVVWFLVRRENAPDPPLRLRAARLSYQASMSLRSSSTAASTTC